MIWGVGTISRKIFWGLLIASGLLISQLASMAMAKENVATKAKNIEVSSMPNPIWTSDKAADGGYDKTNGWLGDWGQYAPWIKFTWDDTVWIDEVSLMQANFREAGNGRYARPKDIRLEFDNGDFLDFTLQDNESSLQKMTFEPVGTKSLKIVIKSVYPDAKIKTLAGFQEVEIYKTDKPVGPAQVRGLTTNQPQGAGSGAIDERERRILKLLNDLMLELEEYFSQN